MFGNFFERKTVMAATLATAASAPFVFSNGKDTLQSWWPARDSYTPGAISYPQRLLNGTRAADAVAGPPSILPPSEVRPIEGPPAAHPRDVFRFDITPQWVIQRWPRVSTLPMPSQADPRASIKGFRVSLVTGTKPEDIAGSLTYYFDGRDQLQRISFQGATGDPRNLIELAEKGFGLRAEASATAHLYVARWNGEPKSVLILSHLPVVRSEQSLSSLSVTFEVNRPGLYYRLSDETLRVLAQQTPVARSARGASF